MAIDQGNGTGNWVGDDVGHAGSAGLLAALRELDGVWGAFVLSADGDLLLWDVPHPITELALEEVAPRLVRLGEVIACCCRGGGGYACVLRFDHHRLCFCAAKHGVVCVLASTSANMAALKMAMNLTLRRLAPLLPQAPPRRSAAP